MQKTNARLRLLGTLVAAVALVFGVGTLQAAEPADLPLAVQVSDLPPVDCGPAADTATPIAQLIEETRAPMSVETTEDIMAQAVQMADCEVFYYCCGSDCGGYGRGCKATCCGYSCDVTITQLCC